MAAKQPTSDTAYTTLSRVLAVESSAGSPTFNEGAKRSAHSSSEIAYQNTGFGWPGPKKAQTKAAVQKAATIGALVDCGLNRRKHSQIAAPKNTVTTTAKAV